MESNLKVFTNQEFGQVRGIEINNQSWFIGKDVAKALGYTNVNKAIGDHIDKDDITNRYPIKDSLNRTQKVILINESGLYSLILSSKLPSAKQFKRWVTAEVLPQIRQTGGYIPLSNKDDDLSIMVKAHQILERTIQQKDKIISELIPKANTYDQIMSAKGTFTMNQVAKQVSMGEYSLFAYLRGKKVLFIQNKDNVPYERFRKSGCFEVIDTISPDGNSHSTTRVTQKGLDYICKLIRKDFESVSEVIA